MRATTLRLALALTVLVAVLATSRPASADVTLTGTVGEIGLTTGCNGSNPLVRFNFTDANQTKACLDQAGSGAKYAYYFMGMVNNCATSPIDTGLGREVYAALLVSKKGATLTCTVTDNQNCHVTSCTLN